MKEFIHELLERIDLVMVVEDYTTLKKSGTQYAGLCPMHQESKPSFYVTESEWYCFGCREGGNAITFIMRVESLSFGDAAFYLAKKFDIQIPKGFNTQVISQHFEEESERIRCLETATGLCQDSLTSHKHGQAYLQRRGVNGTSIEAFRLGIGYEGLCADLKRAGFNMDLLAALSIAGPKGRDLLADKVIIPIFYFGKPVNLYARAIYKDDPVKHKYLPGEMPCLFNWGRARKQTIVYISEGLFDAILIEQSGFVGSVASYGLNGLKLHHALQLRQAKVQKVILVPDNDGNKSCVEGALLMAHTCQRAGLHTMVARLPDNPDGKHDPAELLSGAEEQLKAFQVAVATAMDPWQFALKFGVEPKVSLIEQQAGSFIFRAGSVSYRLDGINSADQRGVKAVITYTDSARNIQAKDAVSLWSSVRRKAFSVQAKDAAVPEHLMLIERHVMMAIQELIREQQKEQNRIPEMSPEEKDEAIAFLKDKDLLGRIVTDITAMGYVGEPINKLMVYLIATSRKLDSPMSGIISSQSSTGKSYMMERICALMPPEDIRELSYLTKQALFYLPKDALVHKFVTIAERVGSEQADYSIRTMQSERRLVIDTVMKDETGNIQTVTKVVDGPMSYLESTTTEATGLNLENMTRVFLLSMDETEQQTKAIHSTQAHRRLHTSIEQMKLQEDIQRRHRNAQRLLKPVKVVIPYADLIEFPTHKVRTRRDFDRFLDLIEAVAFLHQLQREPYEKEGVAYIEATAQDYHVAYRLAFKILGQSLDELGRHPRQLLNAIITMLEKQYPDSDKANIVFTRRDIRVSSGWSEKMIFEAMKILEMFEIVTIERGSAGKQYIYTCEYDHAKMILSEGVIPTITGLLSPEEMMQHIETRKVRKEKADEKGKDRAGR